MDQEERDYREGPPRRGSVPTLKDLAGCLLIGVVLLAAALIGLYRYVMQGAHD